MHTYPVKPLTDDNTNRAALLNFRLCHRGGIGVNQIHHLLYRNYEGQVQGYSSRLIEPVLVVHQNS